jgi:hypothetical protein
VNVRGVPFLCHRSPGSVYLACIRKKLQGDESMSDKEVATIQKSDGSVYTGEKIERCVPLSEGIGPHPIQTSVEVNDTVHTGIRIDKK